MYVNLTDEVGVVDLAARKLVQTWHVPNAHVQNSMALDEPNHRLFIATRNPPTFFVFSIDTGKVVASLPCVGVNTTPILATSPLIRPSKSWADECKRQRSQVHRLRPR